MPPDVAMVNSINQVAHAIGIETIAEHVESDAILESVTSLGVDYAQGYALAVPRPLVQVLRTCRSFTATPSRAVKAATAPVHMTGRAKRAGLPLRRGLASATAPATCRKHKCRVRQGCRKRPLLSVLAPGRTHLLHPRSRTSRASMQSSVPDRRGVAGRSRPRHTSTYAISHAFRSGRPARGSPSRDAEGALRLSGTAAPTPGAGRGRHRHQSASPAAT